MSHKFCSLLRLEALCNPYRLINVVVVVVFITNNKTVNKTTIINYHKCLEDKNRYENIFYDRIM